MRALFSSMFSTSIPLVYCGLLAACTSTSGDAAVHATPAYKVSGALPADRSGAGYPMASMPDFHAAQDAIAALINAD